MSTFDFNKASRIASVATATTATAEAKPEATAEPIATPLAKPVKFNFAKLPEPEPIAKKPATAIEPIAIEGLEQLENLPKPISYKEALAEMPSLEELANEFNNPDQPEAFDDAALAAVHKACLAIESAIDNAEEVRTQLTFIMTELRKYKETAAKIWDSDIAIMVKALRHNYNVVAFAKAANKKAKAEKASRVNDLLAAADASGLFDGLEL